MVVFPDQVGQEIGAEIGRAPHGNGPAPDPGSSGKMFPDLGLDPVDFPGLFQPVFSFHRQFDRIHTPVEQRDPVQILFDFFDGCT